MNVIAFNSLPPARLRLRKQKLANVPRTPKLGGVGLRHEFQAQHFTHRALLPSPVPTAFYSHSWHAMDVRLLRHLLAQRLPLPFPPLPSLHSQ